MVGTGAPCNYKFSKLSLSQGGGSYVCIFSEVEDWGVELLCLCLVISEQTGAGGTQKILFSQNILRITDPSKSE